MAMAMVWRVRLVELEKEVATEVEVGQGTQDLEKVGLAQALSA